MLQYLNTKNVLFVTALFFVPFASAQLPESEFGTDIRNEFSGTLDANQGRKKISIARTTDAPVIDGVLDDAIWQSATVISDLHQFQPVDHGEPSESSVFILPIVIDSFM